MRFLITLAAAMALVSTPAMAQRGPIDIIVDDIFGSGHKAPTHAALIETIPVNVDIDSLRTLDGHSLIINAYAPAKAGMSQPLLIGQTRLLLNGLPNNLGLMVAVPEPVTRDLDFAVINGVVLDQAGQEVMFSRQDEFYRGRGTIDLAMITPGTAGQTAPHSTTGPTPSAHIELIKGKAYLPSGAPELMRGASLTVEVVELDPSGLAGGPGENILGQTFVDIDQEKAPFKFKLDFVLPNSSKAMVVRAHITDWAGRRIFETRSGEPYRGSDDDYQINLEPASLP